MSGFVLPASLPGLSTREAIIDAIYRAVNSFDMNDLDLLNSSMTEDISFQILGRDLIVGRDNVKNQVWAMTSKLETTHSVTNLRVQWAEGAKDAAVTCHGLHQHFPLGEGVTGTSAGFLAGTVYNVRLVQEGDLWKIKKWEIKLHWTSGDAGVLAPKA